MSEPIDADADGSAEDLSRPSFRGCVVCYTAEWAAYAGRKAYRSVSE